MADPDLQISGRGAVIQTLGAGPTGPLPWIRQCLWDRLSFVVKCQPVVSPEFSRWCWKILRRVHCISCRLCAVFWLLRNLLRSFQEGSCTDLYIFISQCSVTCGSGQQTRLVKCKGHQGIVDEGLCKQRRPATTQPCELPACPYWFAGDWSDVS